METSLLALRRAPWGCGAQFRLRIVYPYGPFDPFSARSPTLGRLSDVTGCVYGPILAATSNRVGKECISNGRRAAWMSCRLDAA